MKIVTLEDLNNLAFKNNCDPKNCVIILAEACSVGDDQLDFLVDAKIVKNVECLNEKDDWVEINMAIELRVLQEEK